MVANHTATTNPTHCSALFLAAPASGQGKTTITAALARLLVRHGKSVRIFKTGPDYLDPQVLAQASGQEVVPLDMWMAGEQWCQQQLHQAAQVADVILVEGAMGMFDGEPSSADLAARFGIPIAIVMDVKGMAQTAAAIASGLACFRNDVHVAGLIANNCGSERHRELIEAALPETLPLLFTVPRCEQMILPQRHLGLVQAQEVQQDLENRFENGADYLETTAALAWLDHLPKVEFFPLDNHQPPMSDEQPLKNAVIAVAKDHAFSFIYDANIRLLESMGAAVTFFSPLNDKHIPSADALWLPGGYPELYAKQLSANTSMRDAIKQYFEAQRPILAECGGFLYCLDTLTDLDGQTYPMLGLLQGAGAMRGKRGCQGMQTATLPEGDIRAHAHHRSRVDTTLTPVAFGRRQRHPAPGEAIYREKYLTATYLHLFFPSNPQAIAHVFLGGDMSLDKLSLEKNANDYVDNDIKHSDIKAYVD